MAKNPFSKNMNKVQKPKRSTFDLSHNNYGTYNMGKLYPVMCQPVLPGDSFRIGTSFGLRLMPQVFPLMSGIRAKIDYFYVRCRNLWKDFPDFIYNNKEGLVPPYLSGDGVNPSSFVTGSLADYLGVPTTLFGGKPSLKITAYRDSAPSSDSTGVNYKTLFNSWNLSSSALFEIYKTGTNTIAGTQQISSDKELTFSSVVISSSGANSNVRSGITYDGLGGLASSTQCVAVAYCNAPSEAADYNSKTMSSKNLNVVQLINGKLKMFFGDSLPDVDSRVTIKIHKDALRLSRNHPRIYAVFSAVATNDVVGVLPTMFDVDYSTETDYHVFSFKFTGPLSSLSSTTDYALGLCGDIVQVNPAAVPSLTGSDIVFGSYEYSYRYSAYEDYISSSSFEDTGNRVFGPDKIRISALPFRAYESIYNAFYRDARNNPFFIDGEPEYNIYLPTTAGGEDKNVYDFHLRNWELDKFTSAVPTPQQGVAPLVGISELGVATYQNMNGEEVSVQLTTADDADTVTGVNMRTLNGNFDTSIGKAILATSGISINDFRNVNAFQRWKETNIRRGLKLKDQTKARWGIDISYRTLDMPEFIGGCQCVIESGTIFQTAETSEVPLGSFAGQASAMGKSKHDVNMFADEHGYIIGILSIVPQAIYNQTLPSHFTYQSCLDYFNPEFDQIGLQPIYNKHLCPIQSSLEDNVNGVFGYNRPWFDDVQCLDHSHGLFRTQLHNFLLMRQFDGVPHLGPDFLLCNNDSLNNIFSTDVGDKFLGLIHFDVTAKRPISMIVTPKID